MPAKPKMRKTLRPKRRPDPSPDHLPPEDFSKTDELRYGSPTQKALAGMISPGEPVPEETLEAIADELVEDPGDSESENLTDEDKFPPEELLDGKQRSRPNRALMVARYVSACSSSNSTTEPLSAAA